GDAGGRGRVQIPRRCGRRHVADLRDRRRPSATRHANRRRLHIPRGPASGAPPGDRQRRHLRSGRPPRSTAHLHASPRGPREDGYGIDRLDLVYSVRGTAEKSVPLTIARGSQTATGRHTLFLEDLNVQPGDFISYYVRARDLTRGTRPNEARSDIFFLEVKPYEQEFTLAQSAGGLPGGGQSGIDDLVNAQKQIVVSTWKLE